MPRARRNGDGDLEELSRAPRGATDGRKQVAEGESAHDVRSLQRAAGNRLVGRLLGGNASPGTECGAKTEGSGGATPAAEPGKPLEMGVRTRMERALGADLREVRIHTEESAAAEVRRHGAEALAIGRHVAFEHGRYRPGSPLGDALLAHELAHTIQQRRAEDAPAARSASGRLEADANRSALGAVGALWAGTTRAVGSSLAGMGPRLRSGPQMQFAICESAPQYEAPSYLGPESREALRQINDVLESAGLLQDLIVIGTAVSIATNTPAENAASGSYDVTPQAQALRAVPVIVRSRIIQIITLLLVQHENDMNQQEREFWHNIMRRLSAM